MKPDVSLTISAVLAQDGSVFVYQALQISTPTRRVEMPADASTSKWQAAGFSVPEIKEAQAALPALRRALAAKLEGK